MNNALEHSAVLLSEHRRLWEAKPTLRAIYADFHRRLEQSCPAGPLLDIGSGSAHFKEHRSEVTTMDIVPFDGVDIVADAHDMPLPDDSYAGIVMLDVLHHLQHPMVFLREAERVLRPGGRLAMIEPGMSTVAKQFYDKFHQEPVDMNADPFNDSAQSGDDPFDSNQAIPSLMFATKEACAKTETAIPGLRIVSVKWLSLLAYPLSGGFKNWCLMPAGLTTPAIKLEEFALPLLGPLLGFRLHIVLEKRG